MLDVYCARYELIRYLNFEECVKVTSCFKLFFPTAVFFWFSLSFHPTLILFELSHAFLVVLHEDTELGFLNTAHVTRTRTLYILARCCMCGFNFTRVHKLVLLYSIRAAKASVALHIN